MPRHPEQDPRDDANAPSSRGARGARKQRSGKPRLSRVAFGPGSEHVAALDAGLTKLEELELKFRALEAERAVTLAALHNTAEAEARSVSESGAVQGSMAYRSMQAEVAAALHLSNNTAGNHLHQAHLLDTYYPKTLDALAAGAISASHARVITEAGRVIGNEYTPDSPEDAARREQYETAVVEKAVSTTPAALRPHAKRVAERYATVPLDERYERALTQRLVTVTALEDGMARVSAIIPAFQAIGVKDRLRKLAKQIQVVEEQARLDALELARAQGVEAPKQARRSRGQIEADLFAELLLNQAQDSVDPAMGGTGGPVVRGIVQVITQQEHLGTDLEKILDPVTGTTASGVPVPEITSYGPIPVGVVREIAGATPSWIDVTTAPQDGCSADGTGGSDNKNSFGSAGSTTDRGEPDEGVVVKIEPRLPSLAQRRHLIARDETCRWFGCTMPAHHCDVDHTVAYSDGGKTTLENMGSLCRNHHLLKHHGGWTLEQDDRGEYLLESPTGRNYRTRPASRVRFTAVDDVDAGEASDAVDDDVSGGPGRLDEPGSRFKGTAPPRYSDSDPLPF